MKTKKEQLLKVIQEMQKIQAFNDNAHNILCLDVYDLQPTISVGIIFDVALESLLNEDGIDVVNAFLFDIVKHDQVIPLKLSDGVEISNASQLCDYLEKNNLFL